MPPVSGANKLVQYAKNASVDSNLVNGINNQFRNQTNQQRADTAQLFTWPTRQTITESAKLPAPKPIAPARPLASHLRHQPEPPQPQLAPMHSPNSTESSPRQNHQRRNSHSSEGPGFWPESQIDSHFGSPTTQRSERYDAAPNNRLRSPPPTMRPMSAMPAMPTFENTERPAERHMPYIVGKDGSLKLAGFSKQASGLPSNGGVPAPRIEHETQPDVYLSDPIYNSPTRRQTQIALHPSTVRRSFDPSTSEDDEEVFSDSPTQQVVTHDLRHVKRDDRALEPRRHTLFQKDDEIEGSLASDYPVSDDNRDTPRASRKKGLLRKPALMDSSFPAAGHRSQRDKTRKRRHDNCDYADDELVGMTYEQLRQQPFDSDPAKTSLQSVGPLTGDGLSAKLNHFRDQRDADQKQFFMQMTVSDWERSGDWFLEQFGEVTRKLKEARRKKRDMVDEFEKEIASREEAVRLRTENITKKLGKIKDKGEDMLADKEF
ncbi:hypothetical protein CCHL11_01136 [Colletotrichum chlorophyti]|uniref:Extracellular mutant protein 11 C-terminal domain-containing protein n=1 Tax=Colletotrichum chlorophyti TaxID=708187 RepID=A0A1Q8S7J4_9PEZI|nr:hypothetical protein CCHL11_01136 [Colletotrichum chlorophyti]